MAVEQFKALGYAVFSLWLEEDGEYSLHIDSDRPAYHEVIKGNAKERYRANERWYRGQA